MTEKRGEQEVEFLIGDSASCPMADAHTPLPPDSRVMFLPQWRPPVR